MRWKGTGDNKLIDMAFNKGRADDRKIWMNKYQEAARSQSQHVTLDSHGRREALWITPREL